MIKFLRAIGVLQLVAAAILFYLAYNNPADCGGHDLSGSWMLGVPLGIIGIATSLARKSGAVATGLMSLLLIGYGMTGLWFGMPILAFLWVTFLYSLPLVVIVRSWPQLRGW